MTDTHSSRASNIVLVGMPGAGKSTLGVLLAKELAVSFVDTDILIQEHIGMRLQTYLDNKGFQALRQQEEEVILASRFESHVIATGGSAVYSQAGMRHLQKNSHIVYLHIELPTLIHRVQNQTERGIANEKGASLADIYRERKPLYERWCDDRIAIDELGVEQSLEALKVCLRLN